MFTEPFMQRALLAALGLAPLCALLGVFVTARRLAFFSDTVAHAALAGVAVGLGLGLASPTWPVLFLSFLVAAAIFWLKRHTELLTDTIMALLLSGAVAAGVVGLSLLRSPPREVHSILFGDILAVGWQETALAWLLAAGVIAGGARWLKDLTLLTLHEELAQACGVSVTRLEFCFLLAFTATVAVTTRLLGVILVTSLFVVPPASARNLSRNLRQHLVLSAVFGLCSGAGGVVAAYQLDLPCGPAIVLTGLALFLLSLGLSRLVGARTPQDVSS
jgi:ABC-type Mn2+/Zn2+ transport system permease subunit